MSKRFQNFHLLGQPIDLISFEYIHLGEANVAGGNKVSVYIVIESILKKRKHFTDLAEKQPNIPLTARKHLVKICSIIKKYSGGIKLRKTLFIALILSFLLMTTAISASAANVTIFNNRIPEFAIAFTDNLEGSLGMYFGGSSYKDSNEKNGGSSMTLSLGGRYNFNNVGKITPFVYANYGFLLFFGDWKNPYDKCYFLDGGLGLAYNIDSNWAVVGRTGLYRDVEKEKGSDITEAKWGTNHSIGLKYSF